MEGAGRGGKLDATETLAMQADPHLLINWMR